MNLLSTAATIARTISSLRSLASDHPKIAEGLDDLIDILEASDDSSVRYVGEKVRVFLQIPDDINGDPD